MRLALTNGQVYGPLPGPYPKLQGYGYVQRPVRSLGDDPTATQEFGAAASGAVTGASTAMMLGGSTTADVVGGIQAGILAAAPFAGPAAPVVAAIGAIIGPIASLFKGCGSTCTQATTYANAAATAFQQIKDLYFAQPVRTTAMQTAALNAINGVITQMRAACGNPALGAAGQRCISERLTPTGTSPGCVSNYVAPVPGGDPGIAAGLPCNVYTFYLYPIGGDKYVVPDPLTTTDPTTGATSVNVAGMSLPLPLVLGVAALIVVAVLS